LEKKKKLELEEMQRQIDINRNIDEQKKQEIMAKHEKELEQIKNKIDENQKAHEKNLSELEKERKKMKKII